MTQPTTKDLSFEYLLTAYGANEYRCGEDNNTPYPKDDGFTSSAEAAGYWREQIVKAHTTAIQRAVEEERRACAHIADAIPDGHKASHDEIMLRSEIYYKIYDRFTPTTQKEQSNA